MQNYQKDPINIQHKCIVVITKPKYRINNVFSWITQNVEQGKLKADVWYEDIYKLKKQLADQTAFRLNSFLKTNNNKKGVLIDPFEKCLETPYYIIGDNLDKINYESNNYIANNLYKNDRIVNCSVTQETDNNWTCSITLNNTDDLYTLKNEYYYNSGKVANTNVGEYILNQQNICVIEPNDEVNVFMSNWKGQLNSVFTGLVSSVSLSDDGLIKTVNLQCSDMFKKLSWTYKVVKAGFDPKEAFGTTLSVYNENYSDKTLTQVVQALLGEALCDIYRRDEFLIEATRGYIQNKEGNRSYSLSKVIEKEILKYIDNVEVPKELKKEKDSSDQLRVIGYKCSIDYKKLYQWYDTDPIWLNKEIMADYKKGDIAFKISGMEQPAWSWTINSGSFDFLFSTFKRNDNFVKEIASIVAYEIFADVNGIILFRPPNLVLPRKIKTTDNNKDIQTYNEYLDNYIVTTDKEENYFTNFLTTADDNAIYTQVAVIGAYKENNVSFPTQKSKAYAPLQYINQYGIRMMQPVTRVGLQTAEACEKYGDLLLWRQNKNYELGETTCVLNADYTVGMPIFIQKQLAVWYIKRVTHSFSAGQNCTTSLTLGYKRTPLCYRKDLQQYLATSLEQGKITQTQYDKIVDNRDYNSWAILDLNYKESATGIKVQDIIETKLFTVGSGLPPQLDTYPKYILVWETIPIELYPDLMEYSAIDEGTKNTLLRNLKVLRFLAFKANKNMNNFFKPPTLSSGAGAITNATQNVAVKEEQLKAITTTDSQIQNKQIIDAALVKNNSKILTNSTVVLQNIGGNVGMINVVKPMF